jgi:hypothetical protein
MGTNVLLNLGRESVELGRRGNRWRWRTSDAQHGECDGKDTVYDGPSAPCPRWQCPGSLGLRSHTIQGDGSLFRSTRPDQHTTKRNGQLSGIPIQSRRVIMEHEG